MAKKLELIEWYDIEGEQDWTKKSPKRALCRTVGWVKRDTKKDILVVSTWGGKQAFHQLAIPQGCIKSRTVIE